MIRRRPPRSPRRPFQDFHFFAASDLAINVASRSVPPPPQPSAPPVPPAPPARAAHVATEPAIQPGSPSRAGNVAEEPPQGVSAQADSALAPAASALHSAAHPPATASRPQPATHKILLSVTPQSAARLGLAPQLPSGDDEEEPPGTEALERAVEYLTKEEGPFALRRLSERPAIEQLEAMANGESSGGPEGIGAQAAPGAVSGSEHRDPGVPVRSRRPEKPAPSKARARKTAGSPKLAAPRQRRPRKDGHAAGPERGLEERASRVSPGRPSQASLQREHHERHCTICSHPYRAEIENEFMHWHAPGHIAYDYKISRSAVFRHAHAVGLFARRNHRLRFALGHLIERVQDVEPTADSIVRAIHAFARVNDDGQWIEPPAHLIVSSGSMRTVASAASHRPVAIPLDSPALGSVIDVPSEPALPGTVNRVETDATP
jgi:hypothetical protein